MPEIYTAEPQLHREPICSLIQNLYTYQSEDCGYLPMKENGMDTWWKGLSPLLGAYAQIFVAQNPDHPSDIIGVIVARIKVYPPYLDASPRGLISELYVLDKFRKQKVAQQLFSEAKKWLAQKNISEVELNTVKNNDNGEFFWKEMGFQPELTQWSMKLS
jgi:GNAT superfamily N-acetyltransferase